MRIAERLRDAIERQYSVAIGAMKAAQCNLEIMEREGRATEESRAQKDREINYWAAEATDIHRAVMVAQTLDRYILLEDPDALHPGSA